MKKKGFTLVELLVVIALLGVLMTILLPAIQMTRESARTVRCSNNLRQLALACHEVENTSGFLPSGGWGCQWIGDPDVGAGFRQPGSWLFTILPFLEQSAIYQLTADDENPENYSGGTSTDSSQGSDSSLSPVANLVKSVVPTFFCPTRRSVRVYPGQVWAGHNYSVTEVVNGYGAIAKTDYSGNAGFYSGYDNSPVQTLTTTGTKLHNESLGTSEVASYRANDSWYRAMDNRWRGVIFPVSKISSDDIKDGTSYTFLLGEKFLPKDHYTDYYYRIYNDHLPVYCGAHLSNLAGTYAGWYDYNGHPNDMAWASFKTVTDGSINTLANTMLPHNDAIPENMEALPYTEYTKRGALIFGCAHSGAVGMSMCDASTQRVSYDTDPEVFHCKGVRDDMSPASATPLE